MVFEISSGPAADLNGSLLRADMSSPFVNGEHGWYSSLDVVQLHGGYGSTSFQCDVLIISFILREPADCSVLLAEQIGLGEICGGHLAVIRRNDRGGLRRRSSSFLPRPLS